LAGDDLMAITVEDGTGIANSNSYISLIDAQTLAPDLGLDLITVTEAQLINAMQEITKYSTDYLSSRATATQGVLCDFPRIEFTDNNGFVVLSDEVPQAVINAQVQGASDILNGLSVFSTAPSRNVQSEEVVGAVKISYFDSGDSSDTVNSQTSATINYLKPYIEPSSSLIEGGGGANAELLVNY